MFADPASQLRLMTSAVLLGMGAGVFYDFFRAFRLCFKTKLLAALSDLLFCAVYFVCLFLLGYTAGKGLQRLYAPLLSLAGGVLYFASLSPIFLSAFSKLAKLLRKFLSFLLLPVNFLLKLSKKVWKIIKNFFYSWKICYTMKCRRKETSSYTQPHDSPLKGSADEAEKGRYYY